MIDYSNYSSSQTSYGTTIGSTIFPKEVKWYTPGGGCITFTGVSSCNTNSNLESKIKKVIFNDPATVILWNDGTKTVVKCMEGDEFDEEKGLAMCLLKGILGDKQYKKIFKKYVPKEEVYLVNADISELRKAIDSIIDGLNLNIKFHKDSSEERKDE